MDFTNWLDTVMTAAVAAPSGDNLQPWSFRINPRRGTIRLEPSSGRDPSPMNAGDTMARVSLGSVLMNVLFCHLTNRRPVPVVSHSNGTLELEGVDAAAAPGRVPETLLARHTNRLVYYAGQVSPREVDRIAGDYVDAFAVYCHAVRLADLNETTLMITESERIASLAEVLARADEVLFRHRAARQAFFDAIRKGETDGHRPVREGLPIGTLGLRWTDRLAMKVALRMSDTWLDRLGFAQQVAARTRRLVRSADLLWFHFATDWEPATDFTLGASAQAFWTSVTLQHLACQPMMSLAVLQNMARHGLIGPEETGPLWEMLERVLPEAAGRRIGFVFRVGAAPTPPVRTGRLPWQEFVCTDEGDVRTKEAEGLVVRREPSPERPLFQLTGSRRG